MALKPAPNRFNEAKKKESDKAIPMIPDKIKITQSLGGLSGKSGIPAIKRVGINNTMATSVLNKFNASGENPSPLFLKSMTETAQQNADPVENMMPNIIIKTIGKNF